MMKILKTLAIIVLGAIVVGFSISPLALVAMASNNTAEFLTLSCFSGVLPGSLMLLGFMVVGLVAIFGDTDTV